MSAKTNHTCPQCGFRLTPEGDTNTLGGRVRSAREALNLSQNDLAVKLGGHMSNVSRFEQNWADNPTLRTITKLAAALDVDPKWLMFGGER